MKRTLLFLLLVTSAALADDRTLFGVATIGQPLTLSECLKKARPVSHTLDYDPLSTTFPCQVPKGSGSWQTPKWASVYFPTNGIPIIVKNFRVIVFSDEAGIVQGVQFGTPGLDSQDVVLRTLVEKYGQPTSAWNEAVQNNFGAAFVAKHAEWRLQGLTVTFSPEEGRADLGHVYVETDKGHAIRMDATPSTSRDAPKL